MGDLGAAITEAVQQNYEQFRSGDATEDKTTTGMSDVNHYEDNDFILGLFEDGAYPGVVKSTTMEEVNIAMRLVVIRG